MKNIFFILVIFTFFAAASSTFSQNEMDDSKPGPQHERFKQFEGEWNTKFSYFMENGQIMDGAGSSSNKLILGGRFLQIEAKTTAMGLTINTHQILGYDTRKNKYTIFAIDDFGTYSVTAEGDYDEISKKFTLYGMEEDPKQGLKKDYKFVYDVSDPEQRVFDAILIKPDKSEFKEIEIISTKKTNKNNMKKVTGIGGVFFKCKDPQTIRKWYSEHLGINANEYGATFEWIQDDGSGEKGQTQWNPFKESTKYFEPSQKDFMINYRVADLENLIAELKKDGVEISGEIQKTDYGNFGWIIDPEGNKVELWEPPKTTK